MICFNATKVIVFSDIRKKKMDFSDNDAFFLHLFVFLFLCLPFLLLIFFSYSSKLPFKGEQEVIKKAHAHVCYAKQGTQKRIYFARLNL